MEYQIDTKAQTVSSLKSTHPFRNIPFEFSEVRITDSAISFIQIARVSHDTYVEIDRNSGAIVMDYFSSGETVYAYGGTCEPYEVSKPGAQ
jgi:hypothetical protein